MSYLKKYLTKMQGKDLNEAAVAYMAALDTVGKICPEAAEGIVQELKDQRGYLKLIASENYCSLGVQLAMGNLLTDKYSEGCVGHRFYAGCGNVDKIEGHAANLAKKIFHADHAYVQPHSGADANLVAFWSILIQKIQSPALERLGKKTIDELSASEYEEVRQLLINQKMMGMGLGSGGHLTHGYRHNISSKMMQSFSYEVDSGSGLLDYALLARQAQEVKPLILVAGYSSYPRLIDFTKMREIADSVGAVLMVDMAHFAGLVAGKVLQGVYDPVPYAHIVTTTTHKTLRGPRGGMVLCKGEFQASVDKGCPLVLGGPLPHVMAAKAVAFEEAASPAFHRYAAQIVSNARHLAEGLQRHGVKLLTGGTDNHLLVFDVFSSFGINGRQAEFLLREAGLTVNRNAIPHDRNGPWYTSGVRMGASAVTTLGMGHQEMEEIATVVALLLKSAEPVLDEKTGQASKAKAKVEPKILEEVRKRISDLLHRFPLYPELIIADSCP